MKKLIKNSRKGAIQIPMPFYIANHTLTVFFTSAVRAESILVFALALFHINTSVSKYL